MKIYNKHKYNFIILSDTLKIDETNITLRFFVERTFPKFFYEKIMNGSFLFSQGNLDCMTTLSSSIRTLPHTLVEYLEKYALETNDKELKYNLDCLNNYNTSELTILFLLDFSLIYKQFENIIEKEKFRNLLLNMLKKLQLIHAVFFHSYPPIPLSSISVILDKEEENNYLKDYKVFIPQLDIWEEALNISEKRKLRLGNFSIGDKAEPYLNFEDVLQTIESAKIKPEKKANFQTISEPDVKIYVKDKYKFIFLPRQQIEPPTNLVVNDKAKKEFLLNFLKDDLPKIFYKKKKGSVFSSYSASSGEAECMTQLSFDIWIATETLLDYLRLCVYRYKDKELKYNLDCLDKNYNTSKLDFLFLFDFSLIYKQFENIIEKEDFRKIINKALKRLQVVNTALLHSWPHKQLCHESVVLSQNEIDQYLTSYIPFVHPDKELWDKLRKENQEVFSTIYKETPLEEALLDLDGLLEKDQHILI